MVILLTFATVSTCPWHKWPDIFCPNLIGSSKFPGLSAYSSSKGALNILTEVLAEEFKENGPKFNSLSLGSVNTPMLKEAFPGYKAQVAPHEMASYIFNLANTASNVFNGKVIPVSSTNPWKISYH